MAAALDPADEPVSGNLDRLRRAAQEAEFGQDLTDLTDLSDEEFIAALTRE